jgi:hypothetical protein
MSAIETAGPLSPSLRTSDNDTRYLSLRSAELGCNSSSIACPEAGSVISASYAPPRVRNTADLQPDAALIHQRRNRRCERVLSGQLDCAVPTLGLDNDELASVA